MQTLALNAHFSGFLTHAAQFDGVAEKDPGVRPRLFAQLMYRARVRVLVTGGAGFIGSHVVDELARAGHEVAVLDDLSTGKRENLSPAVRLYEVDLEDRAATFAALADFGPEVVSHQAAQASVARSMREPIHDARVNLIAGLNLLDGCVHRGVKRVVFAGTGGGVYGEVPEGEAATEDTPPRPKSPYAIHKLAFEQLLGVYAREHGFDAHTLRYANVYGPRQDPEGEAGVIAIFAASVRAGRTLFVHARRQSGDGGCVRDYVHVRDVARANVLAVEGKIAEPCLNIGTGVGTSTRALAEAVMKALGREVAVESRPRRAGDVERSVLNAERAERYLGAFTQLSDGLLALAEEG
jgi:UDP-glucose 4-epimerase